MDPNKCGLEELSIDYKFGRCFYRLTDVEVTLLEQNGIKEVFFIGMDKTGKGVCELFIKGKCPLGDLCPLRHLTGDKQVVCKHWLRGLCKKGDQCEFLHEYDLSKMPECFFFSTYGICSNKECPFRHIDPESKIKDCPWYERGFCRHGPNCKQRHTRRTICPNYLCGFCFDGKNCKFSHPSFRIPVPEPKPLNSRNNLLCYNCHEPNHKVSNCPYLTTNSKPLAQSKFNRSRTQNVVNVERKKIDDVTCYKCGEVGHYANQCNKGSLAFLSNQRNVPNVKIEPGTQNPQNAPNIKIESGTQNYSNVPITTFNFTQLPKVNSVINFSQIPTINYSQLSTVSVSQIPIIKQSQRNGSQKRKNRSEITCFKCGEVGHYANQCNKGSKFSRRDTSSREY